VACAESESLCGMWTVNVVCLVMCTHLSRLAADGGVAMTQIDGFHSIFSLHNWRALHHHAPC